MTNGANKRAPQNKANSFDWGHPTLDQVEGGLYEETPCGVTTNVAPWPVASGLGPFPEAIMRNKANWGKRAQTPGRVTRGGEINCAGSVFLC